MKPSPLQLNWVNYISASYELRDPSEAELQASLAVVVEPEVRFSEDKNHIVVVRIKTRDDNRGIYNAAVEAIAEFNFDLETARREYRPRLAPALANMIAVNVARIVYSSAREYLAMMTARAPFGSAMLESVLLEPSDVKITSEQSQSDLLRILFEASEEEIQAYMGLGQHQSQDNKAPVRHAKHPVPRKSKS